ncbi:MAG TPA: polyprenol monophosphomannose synthase [Tepidisphaeraceae bacterium]|nr:polyprenol monophosphomannose synthase [Tepidisphaeraceae bacterium]
MGCSRHSCLVSVIVPTLREAANLPILVSAIDAALFGYDYEILIIDDASGDGTIEICQQLAEDYPLMLHTRSMPVGGLSGAVLCGFSLAQGAILAVMDADLQHPPECLPSLLQPILSGEADFVLGSRYIRGGRILDDWGVLRRLTSALATILAGPLVRGIHDPMSGFFALRREIWEQAQHLDPLGYKIALELLCKCPIRKIKEVPITFALRQRGKSKLSLNQQTMFLRHLVKLYLWRHSLSPTAIAALKSAEACTTSSS